MLSVQPILRIFHDNSANNFKLSMIIGMNARLNSHKIYSHRKYFIINWKILC